MPKKRRQQPTHSRLGNPYPQGLEPVVIDDGSPGSTDLEQAVAKASLTGGIVADYLYVDPDPKWPCLKLRLAPYGSRETDEQYAAYRRDIEQFTCTHSIYLGLCQQLCTFLGNHRTCTEGPCRRTGVCAGIRDQDRYDIPLVLFPPCVPLDLEIIWTYRDEIVAEIKRVVARGNEGRPKAEPATAGRRRSGALAEGQPPETGGGAARERKRPSPLPVARPVKTA